MRRTDPPVVLRNFSPLGRDDWGERRWHLVFAIIGGTTLAALGFLARWAWL